MKLRSKVALFLFAALGSIIGLLASAGTPVVHALLVCTDPTQQVCVISLDPATFTNNVGSPHTVTATVTVDGAPAVDQDVVIIVLDGPNVAEPGAAGVTDASGQFAFTYTGNAGPGTDTIFGCITDPQSTELCINFGTPQQPVEVFGQATKTWVQPATASPTATATATATAAPTPTPAATAVPAAQLPITGASPAGGGSGFVWVALIAVAAAVSTAAALAYSRRRVR